MPENPARDSRDEMLRAQAELNLKIQIGVYATGKNIGEACDYVLLRDAGRRVPSQCNSCDGERKTCYLNIFKKPKRAD